MSDIQISIIERIKNELGITADIDPFELSDLLYAQRNNSHPDKYQDEKVKEEAEEKFKKFSLLFNELSIFLSNKRLEKKAGEVAIYHEKYELLDSKKKVD